jgi:hypothetical protein
MMGKRNDFAEAATAETPPPAPLAPQDTTARLYLKNDWQAGATTYPANWTASEPLELDFNALPEGISTGDIDYLIATGKAESAAMREARLKAEAASKGSQK